ncbi:MAG TPA: hypothetical protein VIM23_06705 [Gaiellaceae bacterium]
MNRGDQAAEQVRRFDFVRLMRPVGEHAAGAEGVICDDATVDEGWVIIELVGEEGQPRGVLDVDLSDLELVQRHLPA